MAITPGKGVKVGSAYVDVTPKLNQFQNQKVLADVNKELQKAYTPNYAQLNDDQKKNQEIQARSAQQATSAILKNKLDQQRAADKVTAQNDKAASLERTKVAKDETRAYQEEFRRRSTLQKQVSKDYDAAIRESSKLESDAAKTRDRQNTNSEGVLHKLATQFRTIGTIARGIGVGAAVLGGFSLLQDALGGIIAAGPLAAAAIATIPAALAAAGVEALIFKAAFKGVGTAVTDAFKPQNAANVKAYNKALSNLTPAAQSFVKALGQARGILPNIQQTFFSAPQLQAAASNLRGFFTGIKAQFKNLVTANGGLIGSILGTATNASGTSAISGFLGNLAKLLKQITPGLSALTAGFLQFIDHVSASIGGKGLNKELTDFGNWISKINTKKLFANAVVAFNGFKFVIEQVGGAISGIIKAFGGTDKLGAIFFRNIGGLFAEINKFSNSGTGQVFLKQLVGTLDALSSFSDVAIKDVLKFLAGFVAGLYPAIKPFVAQMKILVNDIFTPALGQLLGKIAADFLGIATVLLKFLTPALTALINFLEKHPRVLEGLAIGIGAVYIALKISKGVSAISNGLDSIKNALQFFKDTSKIVKGMLGIAGGETAMGDAATQAKGKAAGGGLLGLGSATGPVGAGLVLLAGSIYYNVTAMKILQKQPIILQLGYQKLKSAVDILKNAFLDDFQKIYNKVTGVVNSIRKTLDGIAGFFTNTIPGWFSTMAKKMDTIFNGARNRVSQFVKTDVKGALSSVSGFVTKTVPGWFDSGKNTIISVLNSARSRISTFVKTDVIGIFNSSKGFILKTVPSWFSTLQHDVLSAMRFLVNGIQDIWSKIVGVFSNPVGTVINSVIGGVKSGLSAAWNAVDSALGGKHRITPPRFVAPGPSAHVTIPSNATGGFISKALGGPTQDNVFLKGIGSFAHPGINVSGGEYVLNAKAVSQIPMDYLNALNNIGKATSGDPSGIHIFDPKYQRYAAGGSVPAAARARVPSTLQFLHNIAASGIPYGLGANGPRAYDCSSLVGNVWARLTANPINRRYFVTQNEASWLLGHGFAPGSDPSGFTVGLTSPPEHTVGMLAGHRFEAAHTGTTMRFDDGAADARRFARVFHMIGMSGLAGGVGALPAALQAVSTSAKFASKFDNIVKAIKLPQTGYTPEASLVGPSIVPNMQAVAMPLIAAAVKAAAAAASSGFGAGTALGNVGSSTMAKWIAQASKFANIPANWVPGMEYIMQHESGGNPNAQNNTDINARNGIPSQGLMQLIPPVFRKYHAAGTSGNIKDPVANVAAAANYIHGRYGTIFNTPWLRHTGTFYQHGGLVPKSEGYSVGGPVLTRDRGGVIPTGLSSVFNGTGKSEYAFTTEQLAALRHDCNTTVIVDGVDVTSQAHVIKNNNAVAASLNRRSK